MNTVPMVLLCRLVATVFQCSGLAQIQGVISRKCPEMSKSTEDTSGSLVSTAAVNTQRHFTAILNSAVLKLVITVTCSSER